MPNFLSSKVETTGLSSPAVLRDTSSRVPINKC